MSVAGDTKWRLCGDCSRKFLAVEKRDNSTSECYLFCPKCRAERSRKVIRNITDKWLKNS